MVKLILTLVAFLGLQSYSAQCAALDDVYVEKTVSISLEVQLDKPESIATLAIKPIEVNKYNKQLCNLSKPIVKKRKLKNWNLC